MVELLASELDSVFHALGDATRRRMLRELADGERSVGELESLVGLSQSALSQHLARLRRDRVVRTRRSAQSIIYSLEGEEALTIMEALRRLYVSEAAATRGKDVAGAAD